MGTVEMSIVASWIDEHPGHADQRRREHHRHSRSESRRLYAIRRALGMTARHFSYVGPAKEARIGILRAASCRFRLPRVRKP